MTAIQQRNIEITTNHINQQIQTTKLSKTRIREVVRETLFRCVDELPNLFTSSNHHTDHIKIIRKNKTYWLKKLDRLNEI